MDTVWTVEGGVRLGPASRPVQGAVTVPPSKSLTNRALVAAAVAGGGVVERPLRCDDTERLATALSAMGWAVSWEEGAVWVGGRRSPAGEVTVDLGDSGTGARFVLALAAAVPGRTVVDGSGRLRERPMAPLAEALTALGGRVEMAPGGHLPARVAGGHLRGGRLRFAPGVSSQFVSALALAAPQTARGVELELVGPLPSRPYLALTLEVLRAFGAGVEVSGDLRHWRVEAGRMEPSRIVVEGDWSAAAFPLAAAAVTGGEVRVDGVRAESAQGDRVVAEVLERAGCRVARTAGGVVVTGPATAAFEVDLADTPDLFPAAVVVAASVPPGTVLSGLGALRHKESDRLAVMVENLRRLEAEVTVGDGWVRVTAPLRRDGPPVPVTAARDHRVAMAMAVASLRAGPLVLDDPACVSKSYPGFWRDWEAIVG